MYSTAPGFESFLTVRLRTLLPKYGLRVVAQRHDYLDEERRVGIRPDVLVYARRGTNPLLVLDAKYRRLDDPEDGLNRDLYQLASFFDREAAGLGCGAIDHHAVRAFAHLSLDQLGEFVEIDLAVAKRRHHGSV